MLDMRLTLEVSTFTKKTSSWLWSACSTRITVLRLTPRFIMRSLDNHHIQGWHVHCVLFVWFQDWCQGYRTWECLYPCHRPLSYFDCDLWLVIKSPYTSPCQDRRDLGCLRFESHLLQPCITARPYVWGCWWYCFWPCPGSKSLKVILTHSEFCPHHVLSPLVTLQGSCLPPRFFFQG